MCQVNMFLFVFLTLNGFQSNKVFIISEFPRVSLLVTFPQASLLTSALRSLLS